MILSQLESGNSNAMREAAIKYNAEIVISENLSNLFQLRFYFELNLHESRSRPYLQVAAKCIAARTVACCCQNDRRNASASSLTAPNEFHVAWHIEGQAIRPLVWKNRATRRLLL